MAAATGNSDTMQRNVQEARSSLQTAITQLGLVLRFHRDVKALGVESYAAKAPGSITRPLAQAIKNYNDACDAMEAELMKARRVILHDTTKSDTPAEVIKAEDMEGNAGTKKASLTSATEQNAAAPQSQEDTIDKKPIHLEDDDMDDLFGSANSTNLPSPITTLNAAVPSSTMLSTSSGSNAQNTVTAEASTGMGGDAQMDTSNISLNLGDLGNIGSSSANADFSSMSANDFNNLLASLGAGGGSQQQGNLLGDLGDGNIDFSSFGGLFDGTGEAS